MLTKILTYHVVGQKLTPKDLENGSFDTLEKRKLTTSGSGESYKVNDTAKVVCGNVQTANATVYIIDTRPDAHQLTRRPRRGATRVAPRRSVTGHASQPRPGRFQRAGNPSRTKPSGNRDDRADRTRPRGPVHPADRQAAPHHGRGRRHGRGHAHPSHGRPLSAARCLRRMCVPYRRPRRYRPTKGASSARPDASLSSQRRLIAGGRAIRTHGLRRSEG